MHSNRPAKVALRISGVVLAGALAAACSSGGGTVTPPAVVATGGHGSTTTTIPTPSKTSTTLPECGATRDPLDASSASAPNC